MESEDLEQLSQTTPWFIFFVHRNDVKYGIDWEKMISALKLEGNSCPENKKLPF